MGAGRAYAEDGSDLGSDAVFFGYVYKGLEVGVDVIFVLCARVVYKYLHGFDVGKRVIVADIAKMMGVTFVLNAARLAVYADYLMSCAEKTLGNSLADALRGSCY